MYGYNKPRGRFTLSPKEKFLLGPQFTLQASATAVQERPPAKKDVNQKGVDPLTTAHGGSSQRRSTQLSDLSSPATDSIGSASVAYLYRQSSSGSAGKRQYSSSSITAALDSSKTFMPSSAYENAEIQGGQSQSVYSGHLSTHLPGDKVSFRESPSVVGVPVVFRSPEEKSANSERLNLDRRNLVICPILEGEEQLRLLNYQHNTIRRIENLDSLRRLIFLDFYDNQIECIDGLSTLKSLRVLMLGKNRLKRIENLENLTKLDVLDLHGNQIKHVEGLHHLVDLRVLNLAGNVIEHVKNLAGLESLVELNFRRNHIRTVAEIDCLPNLQRLFLSFNNIVSLEDISSVGDSTSISELALDGNPIDQDSNYKQNVLRFVQQIRLLDMKRVTDDERRVANVMGRKEEEKKRENSKIAAVTEKRRRAINTVRRHWERTQTENKDDLHARYVGSVPNNDLITDAPVSDVSAVSLAQERSDGGQVSRPVSAKSGHVEKEAAASSNARPNSVGPTIGVANSTDKQIMQGKESSHEPVESLSEIDGDTLQLYGAGSLDAFERNWGIQAAGSVSTVSFHFVDFVDIARVLPKIRIRFPNVTSLIFSSTNIRTLVQLNAMATVRRLDNLVIETEGNPVTRLSLWRPYIIFRLAHFTLKRVNGVEVSVADIVNAEKFFGPLANIITSKVPTFRLAVLLGDRKKQLLTDDRLKRTQNESLKLFTSGSEKTETIGRAVLTYNVAMPTSGASALDPTSRPAIVRNLCSGLLEDAVVAGQYRSTLASEWSNILGEFVRKAVVDMWDRNAYMKRCLAAESATGNVADKAARDGTGSWKEMIDESFQDT